MASAQSALVYLTDGVFLFRLAGVTPGAPEPTVELEDCFLPDVVRVPVAQLRARGLRVITPAPSA
jgi:hypothetical protein